MALRATMKIGVEYLGSNFIFEFKREREKDRLIRYKDFQDELETLKDKTLSETKYREFCFENLISVSGEGSKQEDGTIITVEDIKSGNCYPEVIKAATEAYMYILRGAEAEAAKKLILD